MSDFVYPCCLACKGSTVNKRTVDPATYLPQPLCPAYPLVSAVVTTQSLPLVKGSQLRKPGPHGPLEPFCTQQGLGLAEQGSWQWPVGPPAVLHAHRGFILFEQLSKYGKPWQHSFISQMSLC